MLLALNVKLRIEPSQWDPVLRIAANERSDGGALLNYRKYSRGGMREWLKRAVLKTAVRETVPGVRIPVPPPSSLAFAVYAPFCNGRRKSPVGTVFHLALRRQQKPLCRRARLGETA